MANIDQYNNAFVEVFGVNASTLNDDFSKESVDTWDSVHQLNIIALLEESFDVMFDQKVRENLHNMKASNKNKKY